MRLRPAALGGLATLLTAAAASPSDPPSRGSQDPPRSAAWLSLLPDGEAKRKFILDCTGCHQFDQTIARPAGKPRTEAQWAEAVTRMLGYAGATTSFPVIAADRDAGATAAWLVRSLRGADVADLPVAASRPADVREYLMPVAQDLPHDLVVEPGGDVVITGMFTHRLYRLQQETGALSEIEIRGVPSANPRAIDRDAEGRTWVVLGQPTRLAMVAADTAWRSWDVGMYPHSLAVAPDGRVWFNGHFTREPELIGYVDPERDTVVTHRVPPHPTLAKGPGGPIPYEIRAAPDGRIWLGELQGNRLVAFTPGSGKFRSYTMPTPHSGPRRFDVDAKGVLWIPAYSANLLVRLDPATGKFTEIRLPVKDALPYVARVDPRDGAIWIGTGAADALLRYDPRSRRFETFPLPSRGALVRHLAVDPESGAVWLAYGASPGIPARVARAVVQEKGRERWNVKSEK
jgi:virginiamycin B lyase